MSRRVANRRRLLLAVPASLLLLAGCGRRGRLRLPEPAAPAPPAAQPREDE
jgi:predicted small lipoprotein YifL